MGGIDTLGPTNSYENFGPVFPRGGLSETKRDLTIRDRLAVGAIPFDLAKSPAVEQIFEPVTFAAWFAEPFVAEVIKGIFEFIFVTDGFLAVSGQGVVTRNLRPVRRVRALPDLGSEPGPFGPVDKRSVDLTLSVENGTFLGAD